MNRDSLWNISCERAVLDREEFLAAWSGTGNNEIIDATNSEIKRFGALKNMSFKESVSSDREGVRLALLSAECWYAGSESAQVGREKRHAASMHKKIQELRTKLFGRTRLEVALDNTVAVPIHRIRELKQSELSPRDFVATLSN